MLKNNFSKLTVKIQGRNVHPGYAKDKMLNAILIAMEYNDLLPVNMRPEFTTGYDGFYHLIKMEGSVEESVIVYIVRDHDRAKFENKKVFASKVATFLNDKYGKNVVIAELTDQYYNMKEMVEPVFHIVQTAIKAMELCGVEPHVMPIRGGTDGSRLSYMNLPCPNIFAGGMNFHGRYEYVSLDTMRKASQVIVKIVELYAGK